MKTGTLLISLGFKLQRKTTCFATIKTTYTVIILLLVLISLLVNFHTIDPYKRPPIQHMKPILNPFVESQSENNWIKRMEEKYMKINKKITIRKLYEMYAFDFELFNYDAEGYKGSDNTQKDFVYLN